MRMQGRFKDMNIFGRIGSFSEHRWGQRGLGCLLSVVLVFATLPQNVWAQDQAAQDQAAPAQPAPVQGAGDQSSAPAQGAPAPVPYTQQGPEQLQQLVAPIALYPDSLVAQILAASTFPEQVVEADRWVQA